MAFFKFRLPGQGAEQPQGNANPTPAESVEAMRRRARGTGVEYLVRGSKYDPMDVDRWWQHRPDLRFVLFESQKLLLYWIGVAD